MKRHKIVLYNPDVVFYTMPLALTAVGSHLPSDRFEVTIIDGRLEENPVRRVKDAIDEALCLGITVLTGAPIRDALKISRAARAQRSNLPIVWGGWHPSLFPTEILKESCVDVTVQAQGEATFRELVEALVAGDGLSEIKGIAYKEDGQINQNPARPMVDMDNLSSHDYSLFPVERYFERKERRQLDYISSAGCYWRCAFCADPFVFDRNWTAIPPERMGAELEDLDTRYDLDEVSFQDETFFTHARRVNAVADEILNRDLQFRWQGTMRADQGYRLDDDDFQHLAASGLRHVLIGVESGDPDMLEWMSKDITLEQVMDSAQKCRRHGIGATFPFIVGFPNETDQSVRASLDLAKRLRRMSPDFETPIFYYKPYPGSEITRQVVQNGYSLPESLEEWANFDYVESAGPWVSRDKHRYVERFKFYNRAASTRNTGWRKPLQKLAEWRCEHDYFAAPIEKKLVDWLAPRPALS